MHTAPIGINPNLARLNPYTEVPFRGKKPQAGGFAFLPAITAGIAALKTVQPFQKAKNWANGTAPLAQAMPRPATQWETNTVIATDWSSWSIWILPIVGALSLLIGVAGMLIGIFAVRSRKP